MNWKKFMSLFLVLLCCIIIYLFSGQSGELSSELSNTVLKYANSSYFFEIILSYISVRKVAHFLLYFVLGFVVFIMLVVWVKFKNSMLYYLVTLGVSFLYACSDELHQYFVEGRLSCFRDVMIDVSGTIFALVLCSIIHIFYFLLKEG